MLSAVASVSLADRHFLTVPTSLCPPLTVPVPPGLSRQIGLVNSEVAHLVEQRMMASDSSDDKLGMFRQQAAIVAKKKEAAAEKLQEMQQQLQQIMDDLAVRHGAGRGQRGDPHAGWGGDRNWVTWRRGDGHWRVIYDPIHRYAILVS